MIRSAASLARRVAGALGLAVLAMLAVTALCGAAPADARPVGPACTAAAGPATAAISPAAPDALAHGAALDRAGLDRPAVSAVDFECGPGDFELARVPTDAPRRVLGSIASFRSTSDAILASAPGGSPLRPPRVA